MDKEEKKAAKAAKKSLKKGKGLIADFRAFISRGNVLDMAVGVVIGGAFGAIVTALVGILLSLCMWPVPGGITGLVTVLPAVSEAQNAPAGYENIYSVTDFLAKGFSSTEAGMYIQHGSYYYYKGCAIIDWGAFINAIISFIIIAIVLFAIIKTVSYVNRLKDEAIIKAKEEYYKKHPEARPAPVPVEAPKPTQEELLTQIRDLLAAQQKKK